jgi:glycerol-3-phosphate dehydrogenase
MRVAGTVPRPSLAGEHYQVVVIGGGINGVAVARECARAGQRVLLLEQHDFASGTTSRSTRIIHGGLRYLEHGEIDLVRESLHERDQLLRERPYLVRPMEFVLALPKHNPFSLRSALAVRAGLQLYRWMSGEKRLTGHYRFERALDLGENLTVFRYEDAQCEFPERLVSEWLVAAAYAGARIRNYAKVIGIGKAAGKLQVRFEDSLRGEIAGVHADVVINASGPWVDEVCRHAYAQKNRLIGGVRGSHILIERFVGAPTSAVYSEAKDGRAFFILPWNEQILVGTTEVRDDRDPSKATASAAEIRYLIDGFNQVFPRHAIAENDVRATFSGIRPLPAESGNNLSRITRRNFIHDHTDDGLAGFYSLIGGKLTTAASLARECANKIGMNVQRESAPMVAMGPASGFESTVTQWSRQAAVICGVPEQAARAAAEWHGRCALPILRQAAAHPALAHPITDGSKHLLVEAMHAVQREFAVTLGDILLRRVPIALTGTWSCEQSAEAARNIGRILGWSDQKIGEELVGFHLERERLLHPSGADTRSPLPAEHAA